MVALRATQHGLARHVGLSRANWEQNDDAINHDKPRRTAPYSAIASARWG
jgi:hypothetical protein